MEDDKSLNPDNIFCQAQVDVQKMIDQLEEQVESDQEEESATRNLSLDFLLLVRTHNQFRVLKGH